LPQEANTHCHGHRRNIFVETRQATVWVREHSSTLHDEVHEEAHEEVVKRFMRRRRLQQCCLEETAPLEPWRSTAASQRPRMAAGAYAPVS
jgi:hypothetical protein